MPSLANQTQDQIIAHAVNLMRLDAGMRGKVLAMLKTLEGNLAADLARVDPTGTQRTAYQQARLVALLQQTRDTIRSAYSEIYQDTQKDLRQLSLLESQFALDVINKPVGIELASVAVSRETLVALAKDTLIQGSASREWWSRQAVNLQRQFADQMRQGVLRGETLSDLVRRVRGRRENGFNDGVMQTSYRDASALVRTSTMAVTNAADLETYKANPDVIKGYQQISTLDGRTSVVCLAYSGKTWDLEGRPIGHNLPFNGGCPRHWNCRSRIIPWLRSWQELSRSGAMITGGRPTSVSRYFEQRLRDRGFDDARIAAAKQQMRASMDGQVPDSTSFSAWLRSKEKDSPGFASEMLGPTRARLFLNGKVSLQDMLNFNGEKVLTLDQLKERLAA